MRESTFVENLKRAYDSEGFLTRREVGAGYGIADLVLVKLNPAQCKIRNGHKQISPLTKEEYFRTLKYIPDQDDNRDPIDFITLLQKTRLSKPLLKYKILRELENSGYIKKIDGEKYLKINGWVPLAEEVIAIEAKLTAWKQGFIQANRYKSFADKVYLALPIQTAHLVDIELLKRHNVGLIIFDVETNQKSTLIEPIKDSPADLDKRNFVSEFFWQMDKISIVPHS